MPERNHAHAHASCAGHHRAPMGRAPRCGSPRPTAFQGSAHRGCSEPAARRFPVRPCAPQDRHGRPTAPQPRPAPTTSCPRRMHSARGPRLCLLDTAQLLEAVLELLLLLAGARLGLGESRAQQPVPRLELLHRRHVVIDEREARGAAAAKRILEAKEHNGLRVRDLVHLGELLLQLRLWDARRVRVQDLAHKLLALQQRVGDELFRADCARLCRLTHGAHAMEP
mmetsp:Transcript_9829/g.33318  ORF Transcript_9829/g.33318 Transcript_9829/m.33318 type:complete len:225 (+) Transcript_9829:746-1420(+)